MHQPTPFIIKLRKICNVASENGLSKKDLAEYLGTSVQAVQKWLTGDSTPSLYSFVQLMRFCDEFKIEPHILSICNYETDEHKVTYMVKRKRTKSTVRCKIDDNSLSTQ